MLGGHSPPQGLLLGTPSLPQVAVPMPSTEEPKAAGTCQSYLQASGQAKERVHSEFQVEKVQGHEAEQVHLKSQWGTTGDKAQDPGGRGLRGMSLSAREKGQKAQDSLR